MSGDHEDQVITLIRLSLPLQHTISAGRTSKGLLAAKPTDSVKEIAVRCQQDVPLLLCQLKDGMIVGPLLRQFEHPARRVASLLQEIRSRFREIFVEEKIYAAA